MTHQPRKIAIITLHRVLNFGSVLQAHATCSILQQLGFVPEVIDYIEPRFTIRKAVLELGFTFFSGKHGTELIGRILLFPFKILSYFLQYLNFNRFVSTYIPVGIGRFTAFEALRKHPPDADIYMTGSDQVWNSEYNGGIDRVHYLDFAPEGKPRISYAASFGKDQLMSEEAPETAVLLKKYAAISVRESSGVDIIENLGINGAQHVLDPTLLLTKDDWIKQFSLSRPMKQRYLLIYSVERSLDEVVYSTARQIGNSLGLSLVFMSQAARLRSMNGCEWQRTFSTPEDFLRYFCFADFVVASSFHGTAFSVNFNRPFVSVLPARYGTRTRSLLSLVGLSDRIIETTLDISTITQPINFRQVNVILENERRKSLGFLSTATSCNSHVSTTG